MMPPSTYLAIQRRMTVKFIAMDPITLSLIPTVRTQLDSGGWSETEGAPREPQTFKLNTIEFTPRQGVPTVTVDGVERIIGAYLIGAWGSTMEVGDHWTDDFGRLCTVIAMMDGHGYEVKGAVEIHG